MKDLIDDLAALSPGAPLFEARRQRPAVVAATQGSHDALLDPSLAGLSLVERLTVAHSVAEQMGLPALAAHYLGELATVEAARPSPRVEALLDYGRKLTGKPTAGDRNALMTLAAAGLDTPAVVLLAQLIGFLAYQGRLLAGLQALSANGGDRAADATRSGPPSAGARGIAEQSASAARSTTATNPAGIVGTGSGQPLWIRGYTDATLGWSAWLDAMDPAQAGPEALAILDASHPQARESDYYRLLIHQPRILQARSTAYNAIMYAPGGLPRWERELAATVVSRINGCVYCASVHAQRYAQLARRRDVIAEIFDEPETAGGNDRERAIIGLAIDLTRAPGDLAKLSARLDGLAQHGVDPAASIDLIGSIAMFGWANRLMLNLGEPRLPSGIG